jgi:hypothetical protein
MKRRSFLGALAALPVFSGLEFMPATQTDEFIDIDMTVTCSLDWQYPKVGDLTFEYKLEKYLNPGHGRIPNRYTTQYIDIYSNGIKFTTIPLICKKFNKDQFVKEVRKQYRGRKIEFFHIFIENFECENHCNLWARIS